MIILSSQVSNQVYHYRVDKIKPCITVYKLARNQIEFLNRPWFSRIYWLSGLPHFVDIFARINFENYLAGKNSPVSIISFKCDELVGNGQPVLITDVQSHSIRTFSFHWQTSVVCVPVIVPLVTEFNGDSFSLKQLSYKKETFFTEDKDYTYQINFFGGIKNGKNDCPKTAAVCRIPKKGDGFQVIAPASTQKLSGKFVILIINMYHSWRGYWGGGVIFHLGQFSNSSSKTRLLHNTTIILPPQQHTKDIK